MKTLEMNAIVLNEEALLEVDGGGYSLKGFIQTIGEDGTIGAVGGAAGGTVTLPIVGTVGGALGGGIIGAVGGAVGYGLFGWM